MKKLFWQILLNYVIETYPQKNVNGLNDNFSATVSRTKTLEPNTSSAKQNRCLDKVHNAIIEQGDKFFRIYKGNQQQCTCIGSNQGQIECMDVKGECHDAMLNQFFHVGETWESKHPETGLIWHCSCHAEKTTVKVDCMTGFRCIDGNMSYQSGEVWQKRSADGELQECTCYGRGKGMFKCKHMLPEEIRIQNGTVNYYPQYIPKYTPKNCQDNTKQRKFVPTQQWLQDTETGVQLCICITSDQTNCRNFAVANNNVVECSFPNSNGYDGNECVVRNDIYSCPVSEDGNEWAPCVRNTKDFLRLSSNRNLIITNSGNSNQALCTFPFVYNNKRYYQCTVDGNNDSNEWCATTSSYDHENKYGFCRETCLYDNVKYNQGDKWESKADNGRTMACECLGNGNSEWHCNHKDRCFHNGILYHPNETWIHPNSDGVLLKCKCIGNNEGKWTCQPTSYCYTTIDNQKIIKSAGESWVQRVGLYGEQQCVCFGSEDVQCIDISQVNVIPVVINDPQIMVSNFPRELICDYGRADPLKPMEVKWYKVDPEGKQIQLAYYNSAINTTQIFDERMKLHNRRKLVIEDFSPTDRGEYVCEVHVAFDHGISSRYVDVDDIQVIFSSPTKHLSKTYYTLLWREAHDLPSRLIRWQVRYRVNGGEWSQATQRKPEQMFLNFPADVFKPNSEYEFEVFSMRKEKGGEDVLGKKTYHHVKTEVSAADQKNPSEVHISTTVPTTIHNGIPILKRINAKCYAKSAHLSWDAVHGANFYELRLLSNGKPIQELPIVARGPQYKLENLTPSLRYTIQIDALTKVNNENVLLAHGTKVFNTRPTPPREIYYRVEPQGIRLTWKGRTNKYKITHEVQNLYSPKLYSSKVNNMTSHMFPLIQPGGVFRFTMQAIDRYEKESATTKALFVTRPQLNPLSTIDNFVEGREANSAYINWSNMNISPIDRNLIKSWVVECKESKMDSTFESGELRPGRTVYTLHNLKPNSMYDVKLIAKLNNGEVVFINAEGVIAKVLPPPENFQAMQKSPSSVLFVWDPPVDATDIKQYELRVENVMGDEEPRVFYGIWNSDYLVKDMMPNTDYMAEVYSMDDRGRKSSERQSITFRINSLHLRQVSHTSNSIEVKWATNTVRKTVHLVLSLDDRLIQERDAEYGSIVFDGLKPSRQYLISMYDGEQQSLIEEIFVHTSLSLPRDISVSTPSGDTIKVQWINGPDPVDKIILTLYQNNDLLDSKPWPVIQNKSSYDIFRGLQPVTPYRIEIYTTLGRFKSEVIELQKTTLHPELPSPPPINFRTVEATTESILVSWDIVDGSEPPELWQVTYRNSVTNIREEKEISGKHTRFELRSLDSFTDYIFEIRALNNGLLSEPLHGTSSALHPGPTNLVIHKDEHSVKLEWEVSYLGSYEEFQIKLIKHNVPRERVYTINMNSGLEMLANNKYSYTLRDLLPSSRYNLSILSINNRGVRSSSSEVYFVTKPRPVKNFKMIDHGSDYIRLTWNEQTDVDHYQISYSSTSKRNEVVERLDTDTNFIVIFGLDAGMEYSFQIQAVDHNQELSLPFVKKFETILPPPHQVKFTGETETSITVSWASSAVWVDSYQVNCTDPENITQSETVQSSQTTVTFDNLSLATLYMVDVFAMRNGRASSAASGQHLTTIPAPRNFRVIATNMTELRVKWDPPKTNTEVTKYKLSYVTVETPDEQRPEKSINYVSARHLSYKLRGLRCGTQYEIDISAVVSNRKTKTDQEGEKSKILVTSMLDPPTDIRFRQSYASSLGFTWSSPEGEVTYYRVQLLADDEVIKSFNVNSDTLEYIFSDLAEGNSYTISIIAVNSRLNLTSPPLLKTASTQTSKPTNLVLKYQTTKDADGTKISGLHATWDRPSIPVECYIVKKIDHLNDVNTSLTYQLEAYADAITIPYIFPGRYYTIVITAIFKNANNEDEISESATKDYICPPDAPKKFKIHENSDTYAMLSWYIPTAIVSTYTIFYKRAEDKTYMTTLINAPSVRLDKFGRPHEASLFGSIGDLYPGSHYKVKLEGVIEGDGKHYKDTTTPQVELDLWTDVDKITGFTAHATSLTTIYITWKVPRANITQYILWKSNTEDQLDVEQIPIHGSKHSHTLRGQEVASRCFLQLTPVSSCRKSSESDACNSDIIIAKTLIEKPKELKYEMFTPNYVMFTWPKVEAATRYTVEIHRAEKDTDNLELIKSKDILPGMPKVHYCKKIDNYLNKDRLCFEDALKSDVHYEFRLQAIRQVGGEPKAPPPLNDGAYPYYENQYSDVVRSRKSRNNYRDDNPNLILSSIRTSRRRSPLKMIPPRIVEVKTVDNTLDQISVKWSGKKSTVQEWKIQCNLVTGGRPNTIKQLSSFHRASFRGLKPGGEYKIIVTGTSCGDIGRYHGGCLETRKIKTYHKLPLEEPSVSVLRRTSNLIELTWQLRTEFVDFLDVKYRKVIGVDKYAAWKHVTPQVAATKKELMLSHLEPWTKYQIVLNSACVRYSNCVKNTKSSDTILNLQTRPIPHLSYAITEVYSVAATLTWVHDSNIKKKNEYTAVWNIRSSYPDDLPVVTDELLESCQKSRDVISNEGEYCSYMETERTSNDMEQLIQIQNYIPEHKYIIGISKIYKDDDQNIIGSSIFTPIEVTTRSENEDFCFSKVDSAYVPQWNQRSDLENDPDITCMCFGNGIGEWRCCKEHESCYGLNDKNLKEVPIINDPSREEPELQRKRGSKLRSLATDSPTPVHSGTPHASNTAHNKN